jgi:hypothetical protein
LYEEAKGGGSTTNLNTKVPLNTQYSFTLSLTKGGHREHQRQRRVHEDAQRREIGQEVLLQTASI